MFNAVWSFITNPHSDFLGHTLDYLRLSAIPIVLSLLIGVTLAVLVSRSAIAAFIAVNLSGLMRAIPVIVFIILMLPILKTGERPGLIALTILGIPPILLNTYTGIRTIDPAIIDAARGIGMTNWQILLRIQAPLVLPVLAAGTRTAAVQIVATATLAAFTGGGGYGAYIFDGISTFKNAEILAGAIPVTILALSVEVLTSGLQWLVTPAGLRVKALAE
ncbi:ABC transporter permease [Tengunoibacter tsumagoiensis]|uniref:Choline ABC transporter permease n=1 Tax=Tengunoibacter tsumagoiensis TaxID=2014871 RepID=A0A401ZXJ7_9CHLR|nr:ABC transporter permease [Tengunoibacter tsumagoiensis]GCE11569.1 choline ABC transporter permease [Tengunoibacter tsumagoiensis]